MRSQPRSKVISLNRANIKKIPSVSGVYMFVDKGKILYVGKSINLRARIHSHLENAKLDRKERKIVESSNTLEYFSTDSEFKALILEVELIRLHHPKYNVQWKDDKSYLYIKVNKAADYPKILIVRKENDGKSTYFGPFPSVRSVQAILRQIRKIFPFCSQKKIGRQPCFYSKIGLCSPCPSYIESVTKQETKKELSRTYRKNIRNIIKILRGNLDHVEQNLKRELNKLVAQKKYEEAIVVRNRFFQFQKLLTQQLFDTQEFTAYNNSQRALQDLSQILYNYLPNLATLTRIECYDISSLSQKEASGSMVVFKQGAADKSLYRKFKIKNTAIFSDFEMLQEVVRRRFQNAWPHPNLIVVDGGKPQVRAVLKILAEIQETIPVIGIAKNPDRLIIGDNNLPTIRPNAQRPGFNLVRFIRDESHRFAHKYHLYLRRKKIYNKL